MKTYDCFCKDDDCFCANQLKDEGTTCADCINGTHTHAYSVPDVRQIGCECFFSCGDDPESACSNSGTWHQHSSEPCPVHMDAPVS